MESIQETFKISIKEKIAPNLRKIGFKGSRQNFYIPSESHWEMLSFQKSMYSDSTELLFTINLYVVKKDEWEKTRSSKSYFPVKPTATTSWGIGLHKRIGHLMPAKKDYWWNINSKTNLDKLAKEVLEAVENYALPEIINTKNNG